MSDIHLEKWQIRMILQAVQHCRKSEICLHGWNENDYKVLACDLSNSFGWMNTKDVFPELYVECFK